MTAVDERSGTISAFLVRPYVEVKRGYTFVREGDVLFAKITPCMQNGKHATARGLTDGVGFASTEFHVVRPGSKVHADWVNHYLRQPTVLASAVRSFTGSAGQQRVPPDFLRALEVPVPPMAEQLRVLKVLSEQLGAVERARAAAEAQLEAANALPAACLKEMFESPEVLVWPQRRLGDLMRLRKEVVHPRERPRGRAVFVGLEHIASGTGARVDSVSIEMADLTGRKPRFYEGDIVYGYLRPYLNKVWIAEFDGLCSVDQYVYAVDPHQADTRFISAFMRSHVYLGRAPVRATPGQLPRIRTEEVASVMINLPPLVEQQRMVGQLEMRMSDAERMIKMAEVRVATMSALPAALLRRAFSGEL
jgi:type I restriction enzyme S subunit